MARSSSLVAIEAKIRELQAKAESLKAAEKPGFKQLRAVLKKYRLTAADVDLALGDSVKSHKRSKLAGRKVKPKYRNPANKSETWAGRGKQPRWLVAALKSGKKIQDFAI
ncbi:DNA-binding protein H-NS [Enhydrobacter aerosaccus]|uniref:DNA-binding protein H-NS n=1 Tax=Enhydrobacter aerosaccus TaxID=225324 RepID=A0A1T4T4R9_9HYPH|nr:H-NS histone family protein [Enhydrobacter aerosaccus]SKA35148.1 DNA-binding protein H-NS [Enhydrobacter aerosaccus]